MKNPVPLSREIVAGKNAAIAHEIPSLAETRINSRVGNLIAYLNGNHSAQEIKTIFVKGVWPERYGENAGKPAFKSTEERVELIQQVCDVIIPEILKKTPDLPLWHVSFRQISSHKLELWKNIKTIGGEKKSTCPDPAHYQNMLPLFKTVVKSLRELPPEAVNKETLYQIASFVNFKVGPIPLNYGEPCYKDNQATLLSLAKAGRIILKILGRNYPELKSLEKDVMSFRMRVGFLNRETKKITITAKTSGFAA